MGLRVGELECDDATMKKMLAATVALLIALGAPSSAWAGYDEGVAAAKRTYTIVAGRIAEYMKNYETLGLPVQLEVLGNLVGFFRTEIGGLNKVVHIWGYDSLDERLEKRDRLANHPDWPRYLEANLALIVDQENRLLIPAPFSPLK